MDIDISVQTDYVGVGLFLLVLGIVQRVLVSGRVDILEDIPLVIVCHAQWRTGDMRIQSAGSRKIP